MELTLSDELAAVADLAKSIGMDKLSPAARDAETRGEASQEVWNALVDTGLTAMVDDVTDSVTHVIAAEGFGYGDPGIACGALWSGAAATLLTTYGTASQAELGRSLVADPAGRGSLALLESFGRAPDEWETSIFVSGDSVHVRGTKVGVPFASQATALIVLGNDAGTGALRAVVVPRDHAGVSIHQAPGSLGLDATPMSTVEFDLELRADALLGGENVDSIALALSVERIRLLAAAVAVGTSQRAIDYASAYAKERVAFGRPIAGFQGVSFLLADKQIKTEAARLQVWFAATEIDSAEPTAADLARVRAAVREAVTYAGDTVAVTTRDAVQVLGGHGFITDHPVELWYRSGAALAALDFDPLSSTFTPVL